MMRNDLNRLPRRGLRLGGLLVALVVLAGTTWNADAAPRGNKQAGPYQLAEVRNVQVRSHDGVMLDGWIASPAVPAGVRIPTVLIDTPYIDLAQQATIARNPGSPSLPTCDLPGNQFCGFFDEHPAHISTQLNFLGFPPLHLVQRGYAVAIFSVRGTGSSEGCFQYGGRDEQKDTVDLINHLARQPWSNGRVGMGGLSYPAQTTWAAAVQAPPALKAIVTAGDLTDRYQLSYSPQGSLGTYWTGYHAEYELEMGLKAGSLSGRPQWLMRETCPQADLAQREAKALATGDRDAAYWRERNLTERLPAVRAAVLDTEGYHDLGTMFQSDTIWGSLDPRTPRVQIGGWWGHEFPDPGNASATELDFPSGKVAWESLVISWFDYWLKGVGPKPRTGSAYFQDQDKRWHEATSWPPKPAGKQVLYLDGAQLAPVARPGATSFRAAPSADASWGLFSQGVEGSGVNHSLCPDPTDQARSFLTRPVAQRTLLAGNPFAYLQLSTDQPGGLVTASLFDLAPDFSCTGAVVTGAQWLSSGSADLGYYNSPFAPHAAPVGGRVPVRVDFSDITYALAPGHRLALTLSHGELWEHTGTQGFPTITVFGDSHLVVPIPEGTLGGKRPTLRYPQRPFTPRHYTD